jgi:hypothetical protein
MFAANTASVHNLLTVEGNKSRVSANELKRIKDLEAENGKLNRLYADVAL